MLAGWVLFLTFQVILCISNCDDLTLIVCRSSCLMVNTQLHITLLFILLVLKPVQMLVLCNRDHKQTLQHLKIFTPCVVIQLLKFRATKCAHYYVLILRSPPYFKPHSSSTSECTPLPNNRYTLLSSPTCGTVETSSVYDLQRRICAIGAACWLLQLPVRRELSSFLTGIPDSHLHTVIYTR
jgi:hypothetical protein